MAGDLISRKKLLERIRRAERFDLAAINGLQVAERLVKSMPTEPNITVDIKVDKSDIEEIIADEIAKVVTK